ncbi:hypothetical protein Caci_2980 [Catenulispora acidiphila DSM 44928]|uniref:Uncharacterized protein n=1 Tax=Catenulispora acidiphila (strain DSM 44928 / JCM 14897 / NBRC 102108 / NRRL B-24433 / ID139908) TaxID=479433 RepID=C7Q2Z7_CATAD|nr:hypothetical protein [Catenulispora acidiphila]ACU71889.1 hypothetical protein Caci_2980 [Catenulispora acidiphila DSM 44928]
MTTITELLAQAEIRCTTGCRDGYIDNTDAVRAWEDEHREALERYDAERRRTRRALVAGEELELRNTEPPAFLKCPCGGAGGVLTEDGYALMAFLVRHLGLLNA